MQDLPIIKLKTTWRAAMVPHPWIFSRLVVKPESRLPPGTIVEIRDAADRFIGRGFYNGHARIGLRLLTTAAHEAVDTGFLTTRLDRAIAWRRSLGLDGITNGMRLVHSEGDGLSGLIIDRFADVLAVQFVAAGMFRWREAIKAHLLQHFPGSQIYWFADTRVQKQESFDCWALPPPPPVVIEEQGVKFQVEVGSKHKTGFFADQRDNRRHLAELCEGKSVADLCCHTGGFGLYAKKLGGARSVVGVDLDDQEALPTARANAELNGVTIDFQAADVYEWLRTTAARGERYDVVVLDPAKQTRNPDEVEEALRQYTAMNRLAMEVVAPSGLLLTCSCSGLISEDQFIATIMRAAHAAGRTAQIFKVSGAAADHPFLANVPEGRYLKAVWCRLD